MPIIDIPLRFRSSGLLIAFCLAVPGWVFAREWWWNLEHTPLGDEVVQPGPGLYVAQVHSLPEGDPAAPYGHGVFLRERQSNRWSSSTLVFAGYCTLEVGLRWLSAHELVVDCRIAEGSPKLLAGPADIVVTLSADGG